MALQGEELHSALRMHVVRAASMFLRSGEGRLHPMEVITDQRSHVGADRYKHLVLVVDGKPMRQFYTSIFLQRLNYHVVTAPSAQVGLVLLNRIVPLVIVSNIDLPDQNGVSLLRQVKSDHRLRDVPCIIYTTNQDPRIRIECEKAGCASYLQHPDSLEELYAAIQMATKRARRFVRLDTYLDVVINGDFGGQGNYHIIALSELGMFVATDDPFSYGSVHHFTFQLPNAPGWPIRTEGQVVYHHQHSAVRKLEGMGVKYLNIGTQEREVIRDFIRDKLMEGIKKEMASGNGGSPLS